MPEWTEVAEAGDAGACLLLGDHHFVAEMAAATAPLFIDRGTENSRLTGLAPGFWVDKSLLVPFLVLRDELLFIEFGHRILEDFEFLGHPRRFVPLHILFSLFFRLVELHLKFVGRERHQCACAILDASKTQRCFR